MNNIFPAEGVGGGGGAFAGPDLSAGKADISGFMSQVIPMLLGEKQKDRNLQLQLAGMHSPSGNVHNIGQQMTNENPKQGVQFGPGTTPDPSMGTAYKAPPSDSFGTDIINPPLKEKALAQAADIAKGKLGIQQQNTNIGQQKANLMKFKAEHPNMKFMVTKGGNVQAFNQLTGEGFDTGIDSGTLSDQDKMDITGEQRMEQIGARGDIQKELLDTRGNQNIAAIGARMNGQKEVNAAKPIKGELPTQTRARTANAARELVNTRPDLAKYISLDNQGNPTVAQGSSGYFGTSGPSISEMAEINKALYGSPNAPTGDVNLPSSSSPLLTNKPTTKPTNTGKPTAADLIKKYGG